MLLFFYSDAGGLVAEGGDLALKGRFYTEELLGEQGVLLIGEMRVGRAQGILELTDPICEFGDLFVQLLGGREHEPGDNTMCTLYRENNEMRTDYPGRW